MFRSRKKEDDERREKLLHELTRIEIHTRRAASQALLGDYRSRVRGEGVDFVEHKDYVPGDDWRRIDWNVQARTRKPVVKVCYEEKEMLAFIVADLSSSMDLGSQEFSKKDVLIEAVATVAFSAAAANMSVGLVGGGETPDLYLRARKGRRQSWRILEELLRYGGRSKATDLEGLVNFAIERVKRPSMFFVFSDFVGAESILTRPLFSFITSHHDLIPVIIEDRLERRLPPVGSYVRLRDLESGEEGIVSLSVGNCRNMAEDMKQRRQEIRRGFLRLGVLPVMLGTGRSPLYPLMEFFLQRKRSR